MVSSLPGKNTQKTFLDVVRRGLHYPTRVNTTYGKYADRQAPSIIGFLIVMSPTQRVPS